MITKITKIRADGTYVFHIPTEKYTHNLDKAVKSFPIAKALSGGDWAEDDERVGYDYLDLTRLVTITGYVNINTWRSGGSGYPPTYAHDVINELHKLFYEGGTTDYKASTVKLEILSGVGYTEGGIEILKWDPTVDVGAYPNKMQESVGPHDIDVNGIPKLYIVTMTFMRMKHY